MGAAEELGRAIADVAAQAGRSITGLGPGGAPGSGVIIGEGRVLTNAHNVRADEPEVRFADGRRAVGQVSARDGDGDLAVISVDTADLPALGWAEDRQLAVGAPVVALADPGGRGLRATLGFVSATGRAFRGPGGRRIRGAVEHTAPLARGSSGGALVGLDGRLLGINTHRLGEGFYLAQAADEAFRERVAALARGETAPRPRLGVALAPDGAAPRLRAAVGLPERDGALVYAVEEGGPADSAGIRRGDLLVAAAGRELARADDLLDALDGAGASLPVTLVRGSETLEVTVTLP